MYIDLGRANRELQELASCLVETSNLDAGSSFGGERFGVQEFEVSSCHCFDFRNLRGKRLQ